MQFSVTVHGNNASELANGLRAHLALMETNSDCGAETLQNTKTTKTTKKTKAQAAEEETFGDTETDETDTSSDEEDETKAPVITADQVRTACAGYVKAQVKKGKSADEARTQVRNLFKKKFGVTTVDQIDESDLAQALALVS